MTELFQDLCDGLFDDAAIFPPGNAPLPEAVESHRAWRQAVPARMVGPFICAAGRLDELAALGAGFPVSVTVPYGPSGIAEALKPRGLDIVSVEVPFAPDGWDELRAAAERATVYVEVTLAELTPDLAGRLVEAGLRLKLRTGGTEAGRFPSAGALAEGLATAVAAGLPFKLTAGLHHAVRHCDPVTGFEHHGFANVLAAVAAAHRRASVDAVAAILELRDGDRVAELMRQLTADDIAEARRSFTSFGTCSISEPLDDLVALDLVPASLANGATA